MSAKPQRKDRPLKARKTRAEMIEAFNFAVTDYRAPSAAEVYALTEPVRIAATAIVIGTRLDEHMRTIFAAYSMCNEICVDGRFTGESGESARSYLDQVEPVLLGIKARKASTGEISVLAGELDAIDLLAQVHEQVIKNSSWGQLCKAAKALEAKFNKGKK